MPLLIFPVALSLHIITYIICVFHYNWNNSGNLAQAVIIFLVALKNMRLCKKL
jgi:hypothetical protein